MQRTHLSTIIVALIALTTMARAVILFDTGDVDTNTTAPAGDLTGSGWQYEGQFGAFLGTPIAPRFFLSAKHFGNPGSIVFGTTTFQVTAVFRDPGSDLVIYQVGQDLPIVAPLYTKDDENGRHLVVIGRGTQRGDVMSLNGSDRGWAWGPTDNRERWGENDVADIVHFSSGPDDALYATFDQPPSPGALPNESHLSSGDSGGAVFIKDGNTWKLAGINYAVDDLYTAPDSTTGFTAAIYDARGYYNRTAPSTFVLIDGAATVPTGFYATRVSSKLNWIYSVIDPQGDFDGNGLSNLLQYAESLDSASVDPGRQPSITLSGNAVLYTYRRINNAPTRQYQLLQSTDLIAWNPATVTSETILNTSENIETVQAQIPAGTNLFVRLAITQN